ncbi:MAG TPA: DUF3303 family protein [Pseudonocardia sp.]|nr:DUF3303 family protein [Pseudonocardia sp.]
MKYVVAWTVRASGSGQENEEATKRMLGMLGKWSPGATVHQFVNRVDGGGGFAVEETDDPAVIARDVAVWSPYLDITVHPVIDVEQSAAILQEGVDFRESV